jgi:hypothetical protein
MTGDLCPKCDRVLSPDDDAAFKDFGICQRCLNLIQADDPRDPWDEDRHSADDRFLAETFEGRAERGFLP